MTWSEGDLWNVTLDLDAGEAGNALDISMYTVGNKDPNPHKPCVLSGMVPRVHPSPCATPPTPRGSDLALGRSGHPSQPAS
jgi:hypothetical protein